MRCLSWTVILSAAAWAAAGPWSAARAAAKPEPAADPAASALHVAAAEPSPTPDAAAAALEPAELARWIAQLDDDRFALREAAQQRLTAAGQAALAEVGKAAADASLEPSTRAVNILLGWAQSEQPELSLGALEQLAALKNRPTESAMANQRLADVREAAALKAIVELGGAVAFDRQLAAFNGPSPPIQIVIGPKWKGGVEGLHHLQAVRRASTLSFHSSSVGAEAIDHLAQLNQLQRIEFYLEPSAQVPPEALDKLKQQLPQVAIEVRGPARLGIAGPNMVGVANPGGAAVSQVLADSAAAKAGIVQGDVITHIADSEVKDFEHLTREIAKCQPGQSVKLKVLRQAPPGQPPQTLDVTVTFDRWGDEPPTTDPALGLPGVPDPLGMAPQRLPRPIIFNNRR
jgi:hypothetical protein